MIFENMLSAYFYLYVSSEDWGSIGNFVVFTIEVLCSNCYFKLHLFDCLDKLN